MTGPDLRNPDIPSCAYRFSAYLSGTTTSEDAMGFIRCERCGNVCRGGARRPAVIAEREAETRQDLEAEAVAASTPERAP